METATSWHSGIQNLLLQGSKWWNVNVLHFLRVQYSLWSLSEDQRVFIYLSLPKRLCLRLHGLATARYGSQSSFPPRAFPHTPHGPRSVPRGAGRTPEGNRSWQLHGHPRKFPRGTERWRGVQPSSEQTLAAVWLRFGSFCGLGVGRSAAGPGGARQRTQLPGPARSLCACAACPLSPQPSCLPPQPPCLPPHPFLGLFPLFPVPAPLPPLPWGSWTWWCCGTCPGSTSGCWPRWAGSGSAAGPGRRAGPACGAAACPGAPCWPVLGRARFGAVCPPAARLVGNREGREFLGMLGNSLGMPRRVSGVVADPSRWGSTRTVSALWSPWMALKCN